MEYDRFFNKTALSRGPSPLRHVAGILTSSPCMISMAGGMPDPELFPFVGATFSLSDGSQMEIDKSTMKAALQYSSTPGIPGLVKWVKTLQKQIHNPPLLDKTDHPGQTDVLITNGSQDGLCKAFEAMVSEEDSVLVESPTYSGLLAVIKPLTTNIIPVRSDHDGLDPSSLQNILSKWKSCNVKNSVTSRRPKLLYCVPNGGNPTGGGLTLERKKRIYELAREYDLIILEDDPYFYIQFNKPRVPSFLSMDEDGRVVRFDSFSKLLASGIGFATGPKPILKKIEFHMQASILHPNSMSQVLMLKVLERWGYDGFLEHTDRAAEVYRERRNRCIKSIEKHLTGMAEWTVPKGGMFIWIKLVHVKDVFNVINVKAREKNVLFVPGNVFFLDDKAPCQYIRASYSLSTPEDMDKAFERLAAVLKET